MMNAYPGDVVFFHHKGEPKTGKVLCSGRHGCTVDSAGEQHKLKWHHIAGHKTRIRPEYKVVEQGDDGMIIENKHGQRRFVRAHRSANESTVD